MITICFTNHVNGDDEKEALDDFAVKVRAIVQPFHSKGSVVVLQNKAKECIGAHRYLLIEVLGEIGDDKASSIIETIMAAATDITTPVHVVVPRCLSS